MWHGCGAKVLEVAHTVHLDPKSLQQKFLSDCLFAPEIRLPWSVGAFARLWPHWRHRVVNSSLCRARVREVLALGSAGTEKRSRSLVWSFQPEKNCVHVSSDKHHAVVVVAVLRDECPGSWWTATLVWFLLFLQAPTENLAPQTTATLQH